MKKSMANVQIIPLQRIHLYSKYALTIVVTIALSFSIWSRAAVLLYVVLVKVLIGCGSIYFYFRLAFIDALTP